MDLNYVKELVKLIEQSIVDEIEIEEEGTKIRVAKNSHRGVVLPEVKKLDVAATVPILPEVSTPQPVQEIKPTPAEPEKKYHEIRSPIVGTLYRSPSPDAEPYVEVGQTVSVGTVLCLIEAMKLMNEIESDVSGKIVKIFVENAQPVEYNQSLFLIEVA